MVRHRDMLQIALVRWFARSHWSCRYSDSLGLSTDHMEKTGFGWPHGPYFPRNLIIGRIPDIVAVTPCSFHQPTSLSIHFHGSAFRRPIHPPITISAFPLPCSGLPRMCPISTRSLFSTPSTALTQNISCTRSRLAATSSLTTFHEFPIFTASITNKGAAWALLHSLSDSAPPRRVLRDGNDQPLVHANSSVHSLASGVSMRFRNCETAQYGVPFPQLDGALAPPRETSPNNPVRVSRTYKAWTSKQGGRTNTKCVVIRRDGIIP